MVEFVILSKKQRLIAKKKKNAVKCAGKIEKNLMVK